MEKNILLTYDEVVKRLDSGDTFDELLKEKAALLKKTLTEYKQRYEAESMTREKDKLIKSIESFLNTYGKYQNSYRDIEKHIDGLLNTGYNQYNNDDNIDKFLRVNGLKF